MPTANPTIAKQFCEQMAAAKDDYDRSKRIDRQFGGVSSKVDGKKRITFSDSSYCTISERQTLQLPVRFA